MASGRSTPGEGVIDQRFPLLRNQGLSMGNLYAMANENRGLNSMFRPRSDMDTKLQQYEALQASKPTPPPRVGYDLKPEGASDQDWQVYLDAKASAQKQRDEGFLGRITLGGEAGYEHWKQGHDTKQDRYLEPLIAAQGPQQLPVPHWRDPARWVPPTQEQPTRPLPEIGGGFRPETNPYVTSRPGRPRRMPLPTSPPSMPIPLDPSISVGKPITSLPQPTTMPRPSGGPFGGGGKGGNFLGRFERLLDGLEGLVGKLGGNGSTPESPFSNGGGGLSDAIETPFTPTQDY